MSDEWRKEPLSNLCSYISRGAAPAYVDQGGIVVINQKCIRDQRVNLDAARRTNVNRKPVASERMLRRWDILVNSTGVGTLGRVAQVNVLPEAATVDSHVTIARPKSTEVDPRYLGFAVRFLEKEIEALAEGSTGQTELARARLAGFLVPVAPRNEQVAIAHILGTFDEKIELNRRMDETLDNIVRALFRCWFVEFEPTRNRGADSATSLPAALAHQFPASFEDSELGPIPTGWTIAKLGDHVDAVKGVSYKGSGLCDDGMPLHNLNSVYEGGGYKYDGLKYYNGDYADRHLVSPGDVIVANTEQGHERWLIGYAAIVPKNFGNQGIASHHIYRVRPKNHSPLTAAYVCQLLNSTEMHDIVSGYANGTTVNMLPPAGLQQPLIVIPPPALVAEFDRLATQIGLRREELVGESKTITTLRDTLLPALMSGQIRARDAGRAIGAVT